MFMRDPVSEGPTLRHGRLLWSGLTAATVLTIAFGLFPGLILGMVERAAGVFAGG
jgi:hypothetical protein